MTALEIIGCIYIISALIVWLSCRHDPAMRESIEGTARKRSIRIDFVYDFAVFAPILNTLLAVVVLFFLILELIHIR